MLEMAHFAEKVGFVGGQQVDCDLGFLGAAPPLINWKYEP